MAGPRRRVGDPRASLEDLSVRLMADGGAVKSVAWEHAKREKA